MRYLTSDIVYTSVSSPIKQGVLVVDDEGTIQDVLNQSDLASQNLEYFPGALCPGFINTHCHLELSHLKNKIEKRTGLSQFILEIVSQRDAPVKDVFDSINKADQMMYDNGIVAVADISNTYLSFSCKENSPIHYHTFIEIFGSKPENAHSLFSQGLELKKRAQHPCSLTPHATYSVSDTLFKILKEQNKGQIVSIHNQETQSEDEMFINASGTLLEGLPSFHHFKASGQSALKSTLPKLPIAPILLVHNTFTKREDIFWAHSQRSNIFWATCPKANLFIENALPTYSDFVESEAKMTIGTDSLASNDSLSILEEMKVINSHVPLPLLIQWACKNGAEFLGLEKLGSFQKGKRPGVNHLIGLENNQLTPNSQVRRIA